VVCLDAFHVVAWATAALDAVRRGLWNQLRRDGKTDQTKALKGSRWAFAEKPTGSHRRPAHHRGDHREDQPSAFPPYLLKDVDAPRGTLAGSMRIGATRYTGHFRLISTYSRLRATPRGLRSQGRPGKRLLAGWLSWAARSRLPEFVALAKTIKRFLPLIYNTLEHGVANALSEATNTHLRLLTRRAYGYHSAEALIAIATLTRGGLCPPLLGRP
jgi:transposase